MSLLKLLASVAVLAIPSLAGPITITYSGTDSGSLNGTVFGSSAFTITQLSNTTNVLSGGGATLYLDATSTTINIQGLGTFTITPITRTFINGTSIGFSRGGAGGADLFDSAPTPAFSGWTIQTSLGPVVTTGTLTQWASPVVNTSGGVLVFNSGSSPLTFQATVGVVSSVPEPGSLSFVGAGLALVGLAFRRLRR